MRSGSVHRTVLVVDDSVDYFHLVQNALHKAGSRSPVHWCDSGASALAYLTRLHEGSDGQEARLPSLILLDVHMPGGNGQDVLREIKRHESLRTIPVIMLTASDDRRDIDACYRLGVNSYLVKPSSFEALVEAMATVRAFWLELAALPERSREVRS